MFSLKFQQWTISLQIYTRSVIDPIPAPVGDSNVDGGAKSSDKQKKKAKMTDEEIMEKLSMQTILYFLKNICLRAGDSCCLGEALA